MAQAEQAREMPLGPGMTQERWRALAPKPPPGWTREPAQAQARKRALVRRQAQAQGPEPAAE